MRVDAHQHYWKLDRGDYGWLTAEQGLLYEDYGPERLRSSLIKAGIDRTIVVQAAPTEAETEYLLELCETEPTLAGVVGWVDLESDRVEERLDGLAHSPYFKGIRPMLQDLEDDSYILRPAVLRSLALLAERDLSLDLLIKPKHLPYAAEMLDRVKSLRVVVDHCAKPDIAGGMGQEAWEAGLAQLAAHDHVHCKLSGLVTEAAPGSLLAADIQPYAETVCRLFGPDRLLYGSDWPVCLIAATYSEVLKLAEELLPTSWTALQRAAVMGGNAARFYRISN